MIFPIPLFSVPKKMECLRFPEVPKRSSITDLKTEKFTDFHSISESVSPKVQTHSQSSIVDGTSDVSMAELTPATGNTSPSWGSWQDTICQAAMSLVLFRTMFLFCPSLVRMFALGWRSLIYRTISGKSTTICISVFERDTKDRKPSHFNSELF